MATTRFEQFRLIMFAAFVLAISALRPASSLAQENKVNYRYWSTNWSFTDIEVGTVVDRLRRIGIDLPIRATGDVSVQFSVSVPLNAVTTGKAYRLEGTLKSKQLRLEDLLLADLSTDVKYADGKLTLGEISTVWLDQSGGVVNDMSASTGARGILTGSAFVDVIPRGAFAASLTAERLSISPLYDLFLTATDQRHLPVLGGFVSGSLDTTVPLDSLRKPSTWTVDADLQGDRLSTSDTVPLSIDTGPVTLRGGKLNAAKVAATSPADPNFRLVATVNADLQNDRTFGFTVRSNDLPLQSLISLVAMEQSYLATGNLDLDVRGQGQLGEADALNRQGNAAAHWDIVGKVASPKLTAFGFQLGLIQHQLAFNSKQLKLIRLVDLPADDAAIQNVTSNYRFDEKAFVLEELDAAIFGGRLQGNARLARNEAGDHTARLQWNEIEPRFDTSVWLPGKVVVSARTRADVDLLVPAASVLIAESYLGSARIAVDRLAIGQEPIGNAQLALQADQGQLAIEGSGELFGGAFTLSTSADLVDVASWFTNNSLASSGLVEGRLDVNRVSLRRIGGVLKPMFRRPLSGFVSGSINLGSTSRNAALSASARLAIDNLVLDRTLLTQRINANLRIDENALLVDSLRGSYAGGQIDAVGRIDLSSGVGRIDIRTAAIDAAKGLVPISATAAKYSAGILSGRLTIETGTQVRGRGSIEVRDSRLASIPAGDAHAAVNFLATNDLSRWSLNFRSIESIVNSGRLMGSAELRSSTIRAGAFDFSSRWSAKRLDFGRLLADAGGGSTSYTHGNVDGMLSLAGTGVRSVADLRGRFDAELDGSQASSIPGLSLASRYLGAFALPSSRFEQGRVRGSIGAGVARLDEFWLVSDRVRVFADGRVQLNTGRMDVNAVISTGNFDGESAAVAAIAEQLAIGAAPPVLAFIELNRLLSDRTIYVGVLGPLTDPRLRVKPLETLRAGAERFLVREATAALLPIAGVGTGLASEQNP